MPDNVTEIKNQSIIPSFPAWRTESEGRLMTLARHFSVPSGAPGQEGCRSFSMEVLCGQAAQAATPPRPAVRPPGGDTHTGSRFWRIARGLAISIVLAAGGKLRAQAGTNEVSAGPLFERFNLTLNEGYRTEALSPLFYEEHKDTGWTWAVPPLLSYSVDSASSLKEFDFAYPVLTYDRYGKQYRWQLFQVLNFTGGESQRETNRDRFTLFPIYFQQRSSDPAENYTALIPFYGTIKSHMFRDEIHFVMWPIYCQTRKRDVVTDNYMVPFFDLRHGDGLKGWQLWPLVGNEHKDVTTLTNGFGDVETVPGHDSFFAAWPIYFNDRSGLGTANPVLHQGVIPAYTMERSPQRDSTTVLWPFFTHTIDREKKYTEWDTPWPFVEFAHGEGKSTHRVWPVFSHARSPTLESGFFLWPVYKYDQIHSEPLERRRDRILFFLYSDIHETNTETGASRRRADLWPLYAWHRDFNGNTRFQVLALLEVWVLGSHKIDRDYSPFWAIWRAEKNAKTGARSQSLLWNLYRHEVSPEKKKVTALFGLYQYRSDAEGRRVRLFYLPTWKSKSAEAEGQNTVRLRN
jgi:hypothetical protein